MTKFSNPRAFTAPAEGVPRATGHRRSASKTRIVGLPGGADSGENCFRMSVGMGTSSHDFDGAAVMVERMSASV